MKIDWDKEVISFLVYGTAVCLGLALLCGAGWLLVFAGKAFLTILGVL